MSEPVDRADASEPVLQLGSLAVVVASVTGSLAAYSLLPSQLRIHWTLGLGPYYGPEFAPKGLLLVLFPMVIAGLGFVGRWAVLQGRSIDDITELRPYDALIVLGTLLLVLGGQVLLIVANL